MTQGSSSSSFPSNQTNLSNEQVQGIGTSIRSSSSGGVAPLGGQSSIFFERGEDQGIQGGRDSVLVRTMSVISGGHRIRETIHSGHFMVSDFEPESEAQDEEYEVGMPIPPCAEYETVVVKSPGASQQGTSPASSATQTVPPAKDNHGGQGPSHHSQMMAPLPPSNSSSSSLYHAGGASLLPSSSPLLLPSPHNSIQGMRNSQSSSSFTLLPSSSSAMSEGQGSTNSAAAISIDGSLTKLFQCMSLAYRQKLTSPKWNRFKGVRLRWKDKIRLNNVIWRCWHMQFIMKKKTLVCQFASPLDTDTHNKPEAVVMEGKYWKRKLSTVAAEYKKWRLFYRNRIMGWTHNTPTPDLHPVSLDGFDWSRSGTFGGISNIIFDDDLLMDFTDTLFTSLSSNQPFAFPNPREIARAGMVADFIQPGLVQLQPNLEDFMDTLEPLQDYVNSKLLPPVPEELENFDPPDSLLSEEVLTPTMALHQHKPNEGPSSNPTHPPKPNSIQREPSFSNNNNSQQQQQQQQHNYYDHLGGGGVTPLHNKLPVLKESCTISSGGGGGSGQRQQSSSSRPPQYSLNRQQEVFAKPHGKPRGRSRSGGGGGISHRGGGGGQVPILPHPGTSIGQHGANTGISPLTQQQSSSILNSSTLLSHLLTNTGGGVGGANHQYVLDKISGPSSNLSNQYVMDKVGGGTPLNMIMSGSTDQHHHDISHHHQQQHHQQQQHHHQPPQPWNPNKTTIETIPTNLTLNFGLSSSKGMVMGGSSSGHVSNEGGSPPGGQQLHVGGSDSPPMGPPLSGPSSPAKGYRATGGGAPKGEQQTERVQYKEHRRVCHINAEQKRRCNIKNGFDTLHSLIPQLSHNPNAKVSKAAMLQKGAEYIRQLKLERAQLKEEIEGHRQQVETLNSAINNCQSMLPATGAPVSRQRTNKMTEMFHHYVRVRTIENWKFWIFSTLIRPLLDSYNNSVSTASVDELCRTVLAWVDQHCSLVDLRPVVLNSLRYLCTTTEILSNPGNLAQEAYKAVQSPNQK